MSIQLRMLMKQSLLPPGVILWLILISLLFESDSDLILWGAFLVLYCLSISPVAHGLLKYLERYSSFNLPQAWSDVQAIVVIGGGLPRHAPEYASLQPTALTLERVRYGAFLHKKTGLPLLASGGGPKADGSVMADVLASDYGIAACLKETLSVNTTQNALFSKALLDQSKPLKIILVTHAWHMPRAVCNFQHAGFDVIPAPTAFGSLEVSWGVLANWIPRAKNMRLCELALHEYLGLGWFWFSRCRNAVIVKKK